jgi:GNAT superfamily N-acetyltransferase
VGAISPPELLTADHDLSRFDCGKPALNRWLSVHALANQQTRDSRTYVVCEQRQLLAYYSLATASIERRAAARKFRHGAPDPIPAILLGKLAVNKEHAGQGIGSGLLKDAFLRSYQVSELVGARIILLDALDDEAKKFYINRGFRQSPLDPMVLMHSLALSTAS